MVYLSAYLQEVNDLGTPETLGVTLLIRRNLIQMGGGRRTSSILEFPSVVARGIVRQRGRS